jgi:phage shock protein A
MNDRMDHITKLGLPVSKVTNSNEGNNVEIDRLTKQLSALKRQVQLQDETIKDCQTNITTLKNNTQRMIQDALNQQMDQVRVVMESMTRKCNDVMMTSVNALRDELTHKYDNIIHQIMNSNNNNNKAIISYDERLNHMWNACENFDVSLKNVHDMAVDCQTELAQVISIARETQKHTDEIELNLLDKITHITNTTTNNNDMMNADQKDDIMKSCDELVHEQVNNLRKELTEYVSTTSDCVTAQNEKLQSFAVLLTESRQDSVTGMNKLAAAGRKQRDKIKEINEKLVRMGDMGITFDRVVDQIQQQDINMNNVILSLSTCQNELSDGLLALDNRLSEHVQQYQIGTEDATRQIDLRYDSLITSIHSIIETEISKIKNDSRFMNAKYVSSDISSVKPNKVNIDVLPTHMLPSDTPASNKIDISNFEMNRSQISISNRYVMCMFTINAYLSIYICIYLPLCEIC